MIKIFIDTCAYCDAVKINSSGKKKEDIDALKEIRDLALKNQIKIYMGKYNYDELCRASEITFKKTDEFWDNLVKFPEEEVALEDSHLYSYNKLKNELEDKDGADSKIIVEAEYSNADYFITTDYKRINSLSKSKKLFNTKVMRPADLSKDLLHHRKKISKSRFTKYY
ncbi:MAG: hypothetical protein M1475_05960 [Actinobacteria bacterium]|nr:hypothetical protein [Actinomycetota bacterium]